LRPKRRRKGDDIRPYPERPCRLHPDRRSSRRENLFTLPQSTCPRFQDRWRRGRELHCPPARTTDQARRRQALFSTTRVHKHDRHHLISSKAEFPTIAHRSGPDSWSMPSCLALAANGLHQPSPDATACIGPDRHLRLLVTPDNCGTAPVQQETQSVTDKSSDRSCLKVWAGLRSGWASTAREGSLVQQLRKAPARPTCRVPCRLGIPDPVSAR